MMNIDTLSSEELSLIEQALTQEIIRNDRSTLIGDLKTNRDRLRLKCKIFSARLKRGSTLIKESSFAFEGTLR